MTGLVIALLVALFGLFICLTILAGKPPKSKDSYRSVSEDYCGNCKARYPMSAEDFSHSPCFSGHRCSLDGRIIESMTDWCIHHKKDN